MEEPQFILYNSNGNKFSLFYEIDEDDEGIKKHFWKVNKDEEKNDFLENVLPTYFNNKEETLQGIIDSYREFEFDIRNGIINLGFQVSLMLRGNPEDAENCKRIIDEFESKQLSWKFSKEIKVELAIEPKSNILFYNISKGENSIFGHVAIL